MKNLTTTQQSANARFLLFAVLLLAAVGVFVAVSASQVAATADHFEDPTRAASEQSVSLQSGELSQRISFDLVTYDSPVGVCLDLRFETKGGSGMTGSCGAAAPGFPEAAMTGWIRPVGETELQMVMFGAIADDQDIASVGIELTDGSVQMVEVLNGTWVVFGLEQTPVNRHAYDAAGNLIASDSRARVAAESEDPNLIDLNSDEILDH